MGSLYYYIYIRQLTKNQHTKNSTDKTIHILASIFRTTTHQNAIRYIYIFITATTANEHMRKQKT